ncbi:MAG: hypothetical protein ACK4UN_02505 [Limisphaerales bacterium]
MAKRPTLDKTRNALRKLAFKQLDQLEAVSTQLHKFLEVIDHVENHEHMILMLEWFENAHTLRPADFKGIAEYICKLIKEGKPLPPQLIAALKNYSVLPGKKIQRHIISTERVVEKGDYDRYISPTGRKKFRIADRETRKNPVILAALADFRARNPEFATAKKMRRRTMSMERNFKPKEFYFVPTPEGLALLELDSLCYLHSLFGLDDFCHTPLLQKVSVNATPHGILIFIPRYWSFDYSRDLNLKEINKLIKAWEMPRQGETLSSLRVDGNVKARITFEAYEEAGKRGLQGEERMRYALEKAGLRQDMEERSFFRILKKGKAICATKA